MRRKLTPQEEQKIAGLYNLPQIPRYTDEEIDKFPEELLDYAINDPNSMTIEGFINLKLITLDTFYEYAKQNNRLAESLKIAKQILKEKWIKGGATDKSGMREGFCKFFLSANHGMKEATRVESENQITINIKDRD